jgi:hypothetical protein
MDLLTARKGNPLTSRSRDRPVRSVGAVGRLVDAGAARVSPSGWHPASATWPRTGRRSAVGVPLPPVFAALVDDEQIDLLIAPGQAPAPVWAGRPRRRRSTPVRRTGVLRRATLGRPADSPGQPGPNRIRATRGRTGEGSTLATVRRRIRQAAGSTYRPPATGCARSRSVSAALTLKSGSIRLALSPGMGAAAATMR